MGIGISVSAAHQTVCDQKLVFIKSRHLDDKGIIAAILLNLLRVYRRRIELPAANSFCLFSLLRRLVGCQLQYSNSGEYLAVNSQGYGR